VRKHEALICAVVEVNAQIDSLHVVDLTGGDIPAADVAVVGGDLDRLCRALGRFAYICAVPPSTNSSIPVTKLESSDARKSAAAAISCG
jgi:hypothetical protein